MEDFKEQVRKSFQSCRSDIENLQEENNSLKEKVNELKEENSQLRERLVNQEAVSNQLKGELEGIKIALDYIKSFQQYSSSNESAESSTTQEKEVVVDEKEEKPKKKESGSTSQQKDSSDPYEALLAYKARANKREVLKQKLVSMISENGIHLSELKFMFVEHFRYCSKATFYNYLKELELEKAIKVERENSKNFVYLNSIRQQV